MAEYELVSRHVIWVGVARFISFARGLIILPILTKVLGPGDYGVWSIVMVSISLILPFVMLGLPYARGRFLAAEEDKREASKGIFTIFFAILSTSLILATCLFFLADIVASVLLQNTAYSPIIQTASLLLILQALSDTSLGTFMPFRQMKTYSILTIIQTITEITLIYLFILNNYGLHGVIIALIITRGISFLISLPIIVSRFGFSLPSFKVFRSYLFFGLPMVPSGIFDWVFSSIDRYMIGYFLGSISIGIYTAAYNIGSIAAVTMHIITFAITPTIFKSYDEGKIDETRVYLSYSSKYTLMLVIPSVFGLSILARSLLSSLTTTEFVSYGVVIVPLVAVSMIFDSMRVIFGRAVQLSNRTGIILVTSIAAGLVNIILNVLFIYYWGVVGAAITTLISYMITGLLLLYYSRKYIKFEINWRFITKSVLASVIMTLVIWAFNPVGAVQVTIAIAIAIIIYFIMLILLKGFTKEELKVISRTLGLKMIYQRL